MKTVFSPITLLNEFCFKTPNKLKLLVQVQNCILVSSALIWLLKCDYRYKIQFFVFILVTGVFVILRTDNSLVLKLCPYASKIYMFLIFIFFKRRKSTIQIICYHNEIFSKWVPLAKTPAIMHFR